MNVHDHLKNESVENIKNICKSSSIDAAVAMVHVNGDFNLSTLVRNANFFGFKEVFYIAGSKKWDRRGSVGTHHYTDLIHFKNENEFITNAFENGYQLIAVENNVPKYIEKTKFLFDSNVFDCIKKPLFIFGEEQSGLSDNILDNSLRIVTIEGYGSVRSLNVGTSSGIVMSFYRNFYNNNNNNNTKMSTTPRLKP
jgi:tRNA G18 (ribose-2'-O)-methylase SpoU